MDQGTRAAVETEILEVELDLRRQVDGILADQSALLMSAVRGAERKLVPLRAYLEALDKQGDGSPNLPSLPQSSSAMGRLLSALSTSSEGMKRDELDRFVMAEGLSLASARKARERAEAEGLAVRQAGLWRLSGIGRLRAAGKRPDDNAALT